MKVEKALCPNCGSLIDVDSKLDAAICSHCHAPYIVSKAIESYRSSVSSEDLTVGEAVESEKAEEASDNVDKISEVTATSNESAEENIDVTTEEATDGTAEKTTEDTAIILSGLDADTSIQLFPETESDGKKLKKKNKKFLIPLIATLSIIVVLGGAFAVYWFAIRCQHTYDDGIITKESTCVEEGTLTYTCTKCGETKEEKMPLADHDYSSSKQTIKEATCTVDGVSEFTCNICGNKYTEPIKSTGHHYGETSSTATCTSGGISTYTCYRCKDSYTEKVPAKGHSWIDASCDSPKTCSKCNKTEGKALGHNFEDCICTRCGLWNEDDILNYIDIINLSYKINSADGFEQYIQFVNKSNKTIKYVHFTLTPYNRVGDKAYSSIGNISTCTADYTGPLAPGASNANNEYWLLWYNNTITAVSIDKIEIEYTDDTSVTFTNCTDHAVAQWR